MTCQKEIAEEKVANRAKKEYNVILNGGLTWLKIPTFIWIKVRLRK